MSRRKDMSRSGDHVVYSGWMVKSPPERKLTGPWKIFRAFSSDAANTSKWKKRFFVLSKPAGSLPGAYLLNYFSDENCRKFKGYIDLEQCLEIIESLDSDQFQHLLAIKTTHKSKERTYFLSTETEEQMTTWVRNLCSVCGMKPDEQPEATPQAPEREETVKRSPQPRSSMVKQALPQTTQPQPHTNPVANHSPPQHNGVPTVAQQPRIERQDSEYIPIWDNCSSGNSVRRPDRQVSTDSVPAERAPSPPTKTGPVDLDDVFPPNVYDFPKAVEEDMYKVPPVRPSRDSAIDTYDVPPQRASPTTPRSSSSESQKADSSFSSQGLSYDILPSRSEIPIMDDTYDIPPSHSHPVTLTDQVPVRPPRPGLQGPQPSQEAYMNLPPNSKAFGGAPVDIKTVLPPPSCKGAGMGAPDWAGAAGASYDIPKSGVSEMTNANRESKNPILNATPPPPATCVPREHRYVNAGTGFVEEQQELYLVMEPPKPGILPPEPRKSSSTDPEGDEYTLMLGSSSLEDSFEHKPVYDHLPARPAGSLPPPRPVKTTPAAAAPEKDTYSIFSTSRTRSFKKSSSSGAGSPMIRRRLAKLEKIDSQESEKSQEAEASGSGSASSNPAQVALPQRVDHGHHPDFSSSSEDENEVLVDTKQAGIWKTTPPAPTNKDTELKYLDLALEEHSDKEPMRSPLPPGQSSPTEYREIDFVKTQALSDVKKWRNT